MSSWRGIHKRGFPDARHRQSGVLLENWCLNGHRSLLGMQSKVLSTQRKRFWSNTLFKLVRGFNIEAFMSHVSEPIDHITSGVLPKRVKTFAHRSNITFSRTEQIRHVWCWGDWTPFWSQLIAQLSNAADWDLFFLPQNKKDTKENKISVFPFSPYLGYPLSVLNSNFLLKEKLFVTLWVSGSPICRFTVRVLQHAQGSQCSMHKDLKMLLARA